MLLTLRDRKHLHTLTISFASLNHHLRLLVSSTTITAHSVDPPAKSSSDFVIMSDPTAIGGEDLGVLYAQFDEAARVTAREKAKAQAKAAETAGTTTQATVWDKPEEEKTATKQVVTSAFESVFNVFKDSDTLSDALKEAQLRVAVLQNQKKLMQQSLNSIREQISVIMRETHMLNGVTLWNAIETLKSSSAAPYVDQIDPDFISQRVIEIETFVNKSSLVLGLEKRSQELTSEIERAARFVKILEGARLVMDDSSNKRKTTTHPRKTFSARKTRKTTEVSNAHTSA